MVCCPDSLSTFLLRRFGGVQHARTGASSPALTGRLESALVVALVVIVHSQINHRFPFQILSWILTKKRSLLLSSAVFTSLHMLYSLAELWQINPHADLLRLVITLAIFTATHLGSNERELVRYSSLAIFTCHAPPIYLAHVLHRYIYG